MSLVSYADSDDSGEEDINEPEIQQNVEQSSDKSVKNDKMQTTTKLPGLQVEKNKPDIDAYGSEIKKPKSIGGLFSSLPAPWMSTVTWANKNPGKKTGTEAAVKITLPNLDNSDSDDDDYVRKKVPSSTDSQKPSGLFSLLPKPKHSVIVKENNPNRPVTKISNRPLIPDSLRRKQTKKAAPQIKKPQKDEGSDDDSDDNDHGDSFFTWNEPKQLKSDAGSTMTSAEVDKTSTSLAQAKNTENNFTSKTLSNNTNMSPSSSALGTNYSESTQSFSQNPTISSSNESTHSQHYESQNFYGDNTQGYSYEGTNIPAEYSGTYQTNSVDYAQATYPRNDYYSSEQYNQTMNEEEQNNPAWQTSAQPQPHETPEQFKKLLGKRGRGEEHINIIDVNADEQVSSSQEWKTNYQKEDADYKPQSKKKGNLPSSQQRRKHQITYLAFQAKEQEWELRNQWSANRQTRRQTQSKYGF